MLFFQLFELATGLLVRRVQGVGQARFLQRVEYGTQHHLAEIVRFLGIVQQPVYLIDVEKADLNVMTREQGPIYSARFLFRCYNAHSGS